MNSSNIVSEVAQIQVCQDPWGFSAKKILKLSMEISFDRCKMIKDKFVMYLSAAWVSKEAVNAGSAVDAAQSATG